jgi:hypothetical protein
VQNQRGPAVADLGEQGRRSKNSLDHTTGRRRSSARLNADCRRLAHHGASCEQVTALHAESSRGCDVGGYARRASAMVGSARQPANESRSRASTSLRGGPACRRTSTGLAAGQPRVQRPSAATGCSSTRRRCRPVTSPAWASQCASIRRLAAGDSGTNRAAVRSRAGVRAAPTSAARGPRTPAASPLEAWGNPPRC